MSEEFLRVATKEVTDDIAGIGSLIESCADDADVQKNAVEIGKHLHKLKGLAPMMGKDEIGEIATLLDGVFKSLIAGSSVPGICETVKESHQFMHDAMGGAAVDFASLKSKITQKHG